MTEVAVSDEPTTRAGSGRWRLLVGAILVLPCWFGAFAASWAGNDAYTDCWENCGHPNPRGAAVDGVLAFALVLLPLLAAGLWRRSRRWQLVGAGLVALGAVLVVLLVTAPQSDYVGHLPALVTGAYAVQVPS